MMVKTALLKAIGEHWGWGGNGSENRKLLVGV
jgi:hypothetical protein